MVLLLQDCHSNVIFGHFQLTGKYYHQYNNSHARILSFDQGGKLKLINLCYTALITRET